MFCHQQKLTRNNQLKLSLSEANFVEKQNKKTNQGSLPLNKCQIQFERSRNQRDQLILLIHHEPKWDRISQRLTRFFVFSSLSPAPAIINTNVFQSGSYFLTTHSRAFKFFVSHITVTFQKQSLPPRAGQHCYLWRTERSSEEQSSCWWYSLGRLSLKNGTIKLTTSK